MKAIVCPKYGPPEVLQLREVAKPTPKNNEVLIKIHAASVSAADCEIRRFDFPGWVWLPIRLWFGVFKPRIKILGQELAGEVEAVGNDVKAFQVGDRVFATTGATLGAHAEYVCLRETSDLGAIAKMPANISYEEASTVPYGGGEALNFLREANIQAGQKVLIIGAGGSFGTFAVQLAKLSGAEVTTVDSTIKMELLRSLGADHVVDYTKQSIIEIGGTYDVIFEVVSNPHFSKHVKLLSQNGFYLMANPGFSQLVQGFWISKTSKRKVVYGAGSGTNKDLDMLRELIEAGKIRPVIDRSYPMEQMVEAHRLTESGNKLGNVVVSMAHEQ
ncbi:MAG: NAD(P)-dependent alcohol dehydrogenase [Anaerolinea sp.]|nr:NAD(P)-dependent alcohol dehydrogenase [Anaerolinea sp.]